MAISRRARSDRELLRSAEAIRAATGLAMRSLRGAEADAEMLERLDANVLEAASLYRRVGGFENELRGLAGHREAIRQRLDAVRSEGSIEVPSRINLVFYDPAQGPPSETADAEEPTGPTMRVSLETHFKDVPRHLRDADSYAVKRVVDLSWHGVTPRSTVVKVYERATGALVWVSDGSA
ncbi:MAG: hypothetical protein ACR2L4_02715 [Actinomycetota bacterium]